MFSVFRDSGHEVVSVSVTLSEAPRSAFSLNPLGPLTQFLHLFISRSQRAPLSSVPWYFLIDHISTNKTHTYECERSDSERQSWVMHINIKAHLLIVMGFQAGLSFCGKKETFWRMFIEYWLLCFDIWLLLFFWYFDLKDC